MIEPFIDAPSFLHPNGEVYLLLRAVTLDNWITWKDVLPKNPQSWAHLGEYQASWIEPLAAALNRVLECAMPGAARLGESPFRVDRWFDPHDPNTPWEEGRCCQFSVMEMDAHHFVAKGRKLIPADQLSLAVNPAGWIQAELLAVPPTPKAKASRNASKRKAA